MQNKEHEETFGGDGCVHCLDCRVVSRTYTYAKTFPDVCLKYLKYTEFIVCRLDFHKAVLSLHRCQDHILEFSMSLLLRELKMLRKHPSPQPPVPRSLAHVTAPRQALSRCQCISHGRFHTFPVFGGGGAAIQFIYFLSWVQNICMTIIISGKMPNLQSLKKKKIHFSFSTYFLASVYKLLSLDCFPCTLGLWSLFLEYHHASSFSPFARFLVCVFRYCVVSRNIIFTKEHGWEVNVPILSCTSESVLFYCVLTFANSWDGHRMLSLKWFSQEHSSVPPSSSKSGCCWRWPFCQSPLVFFPCVSHACCLGRLWVCSFSSLCNETALAFSLLFLISLFWEISSNLSFS